MKCENECKDKKYAIGLDIGTTSVGWACINLEDKNKPIILKRGSKALWGVNLFEEAQTAESRRLARGTRRRFDRRRKRLKLLKELFESEIYKIDPLFFDKLKTFYVSNGDTNNKKIRLTDEDKKIFNGYKTIYHLRKAAMESNEKLDIRLVYLAIHHLIKYRGNFNVIGELNISGDDYISTLLDVITDFSELDSMQFNNIEFIDKEKLSNALDILNKKDKSREIASVLKEETNKVFADQISRALVGYKFYVNKLFNIESKDVELNFSDTTFETKYNDIKEIVGDNIYLIEQLKDIYDACYLKQLFRDSNIKYLSDLMIKRYDQHSEDLKKLKQILIADKKSYDLVLKDNEKLDIKDRCLYRKHINNFTPSSGTFDFNKELIKIIDKLLLNDTQKQFYEEIKPRLDNGEFMPRVTDIKNGVFPYQLNKTELVKIIENQGKYYSFLNEKINNLDDVNDYKLVKLLTFRIPYYVGPLNDSTIDKDIKNKNAWLKKKEDKKNIVISPYNFDEVVDIDRSAEEFINRMKGKCTYLINEDSIPANSLLYSKFKVLNELKQIRVGNGVANHPFTVEFIQKVYEELFLKESSITEKKFLTYLLMQDEMSMYGADLVVSGYSSDKKFANSMKSYIDFFGENGFFNNTSYNEQNAEEIINWITIFEDKDILVRKLRQNYTDLSDDVIKSICNIRYTGWSRLSKKLLTEIFYTNPKNSIEKKNIMDLMWETKENFMQILYNKDYRFQEKIDEINSDKFESNNRVSYSLVEDLVTSPANKKGIYQSLKVVDEIINYIGYKPENIYIEMARNDEEKKRTDNRYKRLSDIYEAVKDQIDNYSYLKQELDKYKDNPENITEKIYLYFIQEGKSLYSMRPLNIETLMEECEVDHIIPRSIIKDDSYDNKALVLKEENQEKSGSLVLPEVFRTNVNMKWWDELFKKKLITKKKLNNLKRSKFRNEDIEGFINRQLVETRQICLNVANILNRLYYSDGNTTDDSKIKGKVVYLNANLSHNYRERFDLFKFRDLNDYHHAHDAYLAAAIGEYYNHIFKKSIDIDYVKEVNKRLYDNKEYYKLGYGVVVNSMDTVFLKNNDGEVITDFNPENYNTTIENTLYRNDIFISKKTEIKTGEFYNQTKKKKGYDGIPLKGNLDNENYGSYYGKCPSYAIMVEYSKKGIVEKTMIGMPIYYDLNNKQDEYIRKILKLSQVDNYKIVKDKKIPFYSIIDWSGQIGLLVGASNTVELCNGTEFKFTKDKYKALKYSLNRLLNNDLYKRASRYNKSIYVNDETYNKDLNEIIRYIIDRVENNYKLYAKLVSSLKEIFKYDDCNLVNIDIKEKFIIEILKLLKVNSKIANLNFFNHKDSFGRTKNLNIKSCKIITKSCTGLKETSYEL